MGRMIAVMILLGSVGCRTAPEAELVAPVLVEETSTGEGQAAAEAMPASKDSRALVMPKETAVPASPHVADPTLELAVRSATELVLNGHRLTTVAALKAAIIARKNGHQPWSTILVTANDSVEFPIVRRVVAALNEVGVKNISLAISGP